MNEEHHQRDLCMSDPRADYLDADSEFTPRYCQRR